MNINVQINLTPDETLGMNSDDAAAAVISALGGDDTKDMCRVQISQMGSAGSVPVAPTIPPPVG